MGFWSEMALQKIAYLHPRLSLGWLLAGRLLEFEILLAQQNYRNCICWMPYIAVCGHVLADSDRQLLGEEADKCTREVRSIRCGKHMPLPLT